mmetsp:Transcript_4315/g.5431  ORF Transcript_4315/g.5431 Transcript_4315/m.5431 type:complete len:94 (-) Transcript_4315:67-348(-)
MDSNELNVVHPNSDAKTFRRCSPTSRSKERFNLIGMLELNSFKDDFPLTAGKPVNYRLNEKLSAQLKTHLFRVDKVHGFLLFVQAVLCVIHFH